MAKIYLISFSTFCNVVSNLREQKYFFFIEMIVNIRNNVDMFNVYYKETRLQLKITTEQKTDIICY